MHSKIYIFENNIGLENLLRFTIIFFYKMKVIYKKLTLSDLK